ncbi:uncharacterized protein LOC135137164 isoform X1 [Zophobas morio]|uniref:uncharacterized protein LOC135137164 isoform X1 n=1 Tax=Zophobas morio TaxID=2755281 RepID=UPI003082A09B
MAPTTSKMSNALCKKCNKKVFTSITCVQCSCRFHPTCAKSLNDGKPVNSSTFTCTSCKNPSTNVAGVEYQLLLNQKDEVIQVKDLLIKSKDEMIEQLRNQIEMLKQVKANSDAKSEISETTDGATSKPFKEKKEETKKEETRKEETRKEETRKEETRREDPVDKSEPTVSTASLHIEDTPDITNILLLGETGVGKSTFINSFANYVNSKTFDIARKSKAVVLIPTRVTVYDAKTGEDKSIKVGDDGNERQEVGSSATQSVKTYVFPAGGDRLIRLIDTPGLGDTEGVERDNQNCEEILAYLAQLNKINAICLLMKPTNDRNTTLFSYCVQRVLSQFHKSACRNVVFLFTNAKGSDYTAGATLPILRELTAKITKENKDIVIPITKQNVFCLDNESFKHLLALEHKVVLREMTIRSCQESWKISCEEILRFMAYIKELEPHNLKQTISINKTKDLVLQLSKPLSDISQLLQEKIIQLEGKDEQSKKAGVSIEELKKKLYKSAIDLEIITLDHAVLVCTNASCVEPVKVGNTTKFQYKTKCHDPCVLGKVNYEILGHWSLRACSQMTWGFNCKHCECPGSKHMNIYYDTRIVEKQIVDEGVQTNITSEQKQREKLDRLIKKLTQERNELEDERKFISDCAAKFAYYLQNNAMTSAYDTYREYIYLNLESQKSLGKKANMKVIVNLTDALKKHDELIKVLGQKQKLPGGEKITDESVHNDAQKLFKLKHMGPKIQEIFDARDKCAKKGIVANLKSVLTATIPKWFWGK